MKKRIECRVSGRVQLVMYRDFTQRNAKALGVVGSVKNIEDGTVFVVAEGEESQLLKFIEKLKQGPVLADVEHVQVEWKDVFGVYQKFSILYK